MPQMSPLVTRLVWIVMLGKLSRNGTPCTLQIVFPIRDKIFNLGFRVVEKTNGKTRVFAF